MAELLRHHGLSPRDFADPHDVEGRLARTAWPPAVTSAVTALREGIEAHVDALRAAASGNDALVPPSVVDGLRRGIEWRITRFERRLTAAVKRRERELMHELGLLEAFLRLPHQKVREVRARIGDALLPVADFSRLPVRCPYIAMIPQWDFLDFLARSASRYPDFALRMETEVTGLVLEDERVIGVECGEERIHADLVVGADGRHSLVRARAGLPLVDLGAPIDVLWFRLQKDRNDREQTAGYFWPGLVFIAIDRGDYWQCAYVIPKGAGLAVRTDGLAALRSRIARRLPFLRDNL